MHSHTQVTNPLSSLLLLTLGVIERELQIKGNLEEMKGNDISRLVWFSIRKPEPLVSAVFYGSYQNY